eukprot:CAMPEP_0184697704 /NCGR_PEP_ID=MMETSP0313-20130426/4587_1 /TAXON_ID=2792 /ORGANISM="Porphyridium aerugineum, Strain SAG 1380-2" /LENGTH=347 /DNA_ID=CAMNT_0027156537 /DNA_START=508 /DNA_END=1551 /DNA_ORIENTATION=+
MINDFEDRSSQASLSPPSLSPSDSADHDIELKVQFGVDLQAISLTAEQEERKREYLRPSRDMTGSNLNNDRDMNKSDHVSAAKTPEETTSTSAPLDSALVPPKGRPRTRLAQVKDMWLTDSEDYFEVMRKEKEKEKEDEPRKDEIPGVSTTRNGQTHGRLSRQNNSAPNQGMIPSDGEDEFDNNHGMDDDDRDNDDDQGMVITSRRRKRPARISISDLKLGGVYYGRVTMITKYGAFIDIGFESPGLVHISEISYKFVDDIHRFVYVGQKIRVVIISVDLVNRRFGCSLREAMDPSLYNTVVWLSADWGRAFTDSKGNPLPKRKYPIPIPPKPNLLRNLKVREGLPE